MGKSRTESEQFVDFCFELIASGPVVQSLVSLTMSLRRQLVKYMLTAYENLLLILLEICENLIHKILAFFPTKITALLFVIFTL